MNLDNEKSEIQYLSENYKISFEAKRSIKSDVKVAFTSKTI